MEIEATWGGIEIASYSDGDQVNAFLIDGVPLVQRLPALRRLAAGVANRQNVTTTITFTNKRPPFGSPLLAAQFIADHALALQAITTNEDFEFSLGDKDYVLHEAVVTRRAPSQHFGATIEHAYTIVGGELEDVTPP